jgi:hypothetical protein
MRIEDWPPHLGSPPRLRKDGRWEYRRYRQASVYGKSIEDCAKKLGYVWTPPSSTEAIWARQSIGSWVETELLPLYVGRRADRTAYNVQLFTGKLLDHRVQGVPLADCPFTALTLSAIVAAYESAAAHTSDNTRRNIVAVWGRLLTLAADQDLIPAALPSRFRRECKPPIYRRSESCPSPETVLEVVAANPGTAIAAVMLGCLLLGADRSECALIARDELEGRAVRLLGGKNRYRTGRVIPLPDNVATELLRVCGRDRLAELPGGKPLRHNWDRLAKAAFTAAAVKPFTLKSIRHTFTGIEHELGCPSAVRVRVMGHSPNSIDQAYQHPSDETVRLWLSRWCDRCLSVLLA